MPPLRLALAQVDATVGDLAGNAERVLDWAARAAAAGADLVAFPEGMLTGYPAEDLVLRRSFVEASRRTLAGLPARLAEAGLGELAVVVGYLDRGLGGEDGGGEPGGEPRAALPQNCAAMLHGGAVVARYAKHHLPNYGVFDEIRYFAPGHRLPVVRLHGVDVAMTICEDLWQDGPVAVARRAGVGLLLVVNGSPYERDKDDTRYALVRRRAAEAGATLAYVNLVGGQDELVFDGDSLVVGVDGEVLARAPQFAEDLLVVDLELPAAAPPAAGGPTGRGATVDTADGRTITVDRVIVSTAPLPTPRHRAVGATAPRLDEHAEIWAALVTATRDYVAKNRFASVVLGLSGGIDSAVVATVAVDALGAERVHTVALPSRHSSEHSLADAAELARRQGTRHAVVPIAPMVAAYEANLALHGLAAENLQARVRGTTLMALSNEHGHLVLTTGNKSELATGYSTLYGDSAGGFAPIKDVPKTTVWALARWRNDDAVRRGETPPIPEASISKPPSAELAPGQLDTDSLPAYDVLDRLLDDYVERDLGRDALLAAGHDAGLVERVIRLVDAAEYKRRQYPPGPKISPRNFGRDRRLPITNRWREQAAPHVDDPARVAPQQARPGS